MKDLELENLNKYNYKRQEKYKLLKVFEQKHLGVSFSLCLTDEFSSDNPKFKYVNYLKYDFLPFAFYNHISENDLNLLAVQKEDIGLIFYSLYSIAQHIEEKKPREIQDWFMQSYVALQEISSNPEKDVRFFLNTGLIKDSQKNFFKEILMDYDRRYQAFIGSYEIKKEPYFYFKYISF